VVQARLSENGKPLVVLADGSAYLLDLGLQVWICIVDPEFAVTAFTSQILGTQLPGHRFPPTTSVHSKCLTPIYYL
jgi:hypothetical protein